MQELLRELIFPLLEEPLLEDGEDAAVFSLAGENIAFTTDSFVVKPLFFPGGDIGKLAVCGTVNDLAMRGAKPLYLTAGLILEEGLDLEILEKVMESMGKWANLAGVHIIAGDTKVVERGMADGMYINTSGVGIIPQDREVSIKGAAPGDLLLLNGFIGDHGMAVLSGREGISLQLSLDSDCAPLNALVESMLGAGVIHALRDPTRGGLAAALVEMARASRCDLEIYEDRIPIREEVRAACEILGLDPLYLANEGKLLASVPEGDAHQVLRAMSSHPLGKDSRMVGRVLARGRGRVNLITSIGSARILRMPSGEQLPRIC
jgi:hydrogenase expression/formation protein HypE